MENQKNDYKGEILDFDDFTLCMIFVIFLKMAIRMKLSKWVYELTP